MNLWLADGWPLKKATDRYLRRIQYAGLIEIRGEILSHLENGVPQTIVVLRYQEIGGILSKKQRSNGIVLSKEYLDRNITIFSMLPTQFIPDFFAAEYFGLRNTIFWGS
jgi:hypothetical protein